jgi:hypothetical protein
MMIINNIPPADGCICFCNVEYKQGNGVSFSVLKFSYIIKTFLSQVTCPLSLVLLPLSHIMKPNCALIYLTCLISFISTIYAIPIQQTSLQSNIQQHISTNDQAYPTIDQLEEHYAQIVSKVVDKTLNDLLENVPETFLTIHELQSLGKGNTLSSFDVLL